MLNIVGSIEMKIPIKITPQHTTWLLEIPAKNGIKYQLPYSSDKSHGAGTEVGEIFCRRDVGNLPLYRTPQ